MLFAQSSAVSSDDALYGKNEKIRNFKSGLSQCAFRLRVGHQLASC
jgi:hypothetical protein